MNTMAEIVEERGNALGHLSAADQAHLLSEVERDPAMGRRLAALLAEPDPEKAITEDVLKAAINQLEPSRFPETAGLWPVLREQISAVPAAVHAAIGREIPAMSFEEKIALLNWINTRRGTGMGSLDDIFSDLWGSIGAPALEEGMDYYTEKMKQDALKDIKEMELAVQREVGLKKLEMEQALAEKKLEYEMMLAREKAAQPTAVAESGLPSWVIPAGIGVIGLVATLFVLKMKGKGK